MGAHMCVFDRVQIRASFENWSRINTCLLTSLSGAKQRLLNQTSVSSFFFIIEMNKVILYGNLNAYQIGK